MTFCLWLNHGCDNIQSNSNPSHVILLKYTWCTIWVKVKVQHAFGILYHLRQTLNLWFVKVGLGELECPSQTPDPWPLTPTPLMRFGVNWNADCIPELFPFNHFLILLKPVWLNEHEPHSHAPKNPVASWSIEFLKTASREFHLESNVQHVPNSNWCTFAFGHIVL